MIKIAVCDDSSADLMIIQELLDRYLSERPGLNFSSSLFLSGRELLEDIRSGQSYDLYLLDIMMPDINGIDVAKELRAVEAETPLVFLTSSTAHALEAFSVRATQYVVKPLEIESFSSVLDRVFASIHSKLDRFLLFQTPEKKVKVPFSSIVCAESVYHRIVLYLTDGKSLSSKNIRTSFTMAITPLMEDDRFLHSHKSYVINLDYVSEISDGSFVMNNGVTIHIPRYKFAEAKGKYYEYLNKQGGNTLQEHQESPMI